MRKLMLGLAAAAFAVTLNAQQLEVNNAGASLTKGGSNPVAANPFLVAANAASWDFRVSGAPNSGYILMLGTLANASTQPLAGFGILDYLDLDQSLGIQILGDGISFSSGLPGNWFFTNGSGQSNWILPNNATFQNTTVDLQAIVSDPTAPPFNLNFTAAGRWNFVNYSQTVLNGDDSAVNFATTHAYPLYGANRTQFSVCTNGHVVAAATTSTLLGESATTFNNGIITGAPSFAIYWDDLNMPAAESRNVLITEIPSSNTFMVEWVNGRLFSPATTTFGNMKLTITDLGGLCEVDYDYSGMVWNVTAPSQGLVGVSDGSAATTNTLQADIVTAGVVNSYLSTADFDTYFQIFSATSTGNPPIGPIDVAGTVMHFLDTNGNGNWLVF